MRIAVIGGGISGLAAAHRVTELLPHAELKLYEAANRLGGILETVHRDGFLVEHSADNFLTRLPWATDLCKRLGIADQLLPTDESRRRASVVRNGKVLPVPAGFVIMSPSRVWPVLTSPLLGWRAKLRLITERFSPTRPPKLDVPDESVAAFATRQLGQETFDWLVQPLLAGIYTADATKLSMAATMSDVWNAARQGKGLWKRPQKSKESGAQYGLFVAPRDGITSLVRALAERLPAGVVELGACVESLKSVNGQWSLGIHGSHEGSVFDAVVLAVASYRAAELSTDVDQELADELAAIDYAGCAIASVAYKYEQFERPLEGFGFVVPAAEKRPIIAASYASQKFVGRAPEGEVLIRVFIGGALRPDMLAKPDDELVRVAHGQLAELLSIRGEPIMTDVARWPRAMPQYQVQHVERVGRIEQRVGGLPGLELAGNAYHGVGIPQCIRSGELAVERIASYLARKKIAGEA